jgi:hypothetical protein
VKDVRAAQVTALNAQGMSAEEYRWIRDQAYAAAGIPIAAFNLNAFIEAARGGDVQKLGESMQQQIAEAIEPTEKNKDLVKPLAGKLGEWASLAWMGF